MLGRDIERDESKGIERLQSNLHCRLDLFSDAQGSAEDVVEEVATIPKRKTSQRLLRRKKPTLDDLRKEMRMVSPRWRGRVRVASWRGTFACVCCNSEEARYPV